VAPYEADAQLAFLFKSSQVDVVFTEDSDLLAFGVTKCFFKMDNLGNGQEIDLDDLNKVKSFKKFNHEMFMTACILSGCDYLDSIKGIGFKKAIKLVDDAGEDNTFHECMTAIRDEGKLTVPHKYEKKYRKAFLTFKF
jgi:exonuclease-1